MPKSSELDFLAAKLRSIRADLDRLAPSVHVRELHAQVETYARTLARWRFAEPSNAQLDAMRDLVTNLGVRAR